MPVLSACAVLFLLSVITSTASAYVVLLYLCLLLSSYLVLSPLFERLRSLSFSTSFTPYPELLQNDVGMWVQYHWLCLVRVCLRLAGSGLSLPSPPQTHHTLTLLSLSALSPLLCWRWASLVGRGGTLLASIPLLTLTLKYCPQVLLSTLRRPQPPPSSPSLHPSCRGLCAA